MLRGRRQRLSLGRVFVLPLWLRRHHHAELGWKPPGLANLNAEPDGGLTVSIGMANNRLQKPFLVMPWEDHLVTSRMAGRVDPQVAT